MKSIIRILVFFIIFGGCTTSPKETSQNGDIFLIYADDAVYLLKNVKYTVSNLKYEELHRGTSSKNGWIRYGKSIDGKYILSLTFASGFDASLGKRMEDDAEVFEYISEKQISEFIRVSFDRDGIELEGGKKYIIIVEPQEMSVSF